SDRPPPWIRAGLGGSGKPRGPQAGSHAETSSLLRRDPGHLLAYTDGPSRPKRDDDSVLVAGTADAGRGNNRRHAENGAGIRTESPQLVAGFESRCTKPDAARTRRIGLEPVDRARRWRAAQRSVRRMGVLGQGTTIGDRSCRSSPRRWECFVWGRCRWGGGPDPPDRPAPTIGAGAPRRWKYGNRAGFGLRRSAAQWLD